MTTLRRTLALALLLAPLAGCGVVTPSLRAATPGLTLSTVQQIQNDQTLDMTEKQQILRSLLGVQDDPAGNRIVNFVLGLNVP